MEASEEGSARVVPLRNPLVSGLPGTEAQPIRGGVRERLPHPKRKGCREGVRPIQHACVAVVLNGTVRCQHEPEQRKKETQFPLLLCDMVSRLDLAALESPSQKLSKTFSH